MFIACSWPNIWFLANLVPGLMLICRLSAFERYGMAESGGPESPFLPHKLVGWRLGHPSRFLVLADLVMGSPSLTSLRAEASRVREKPPGPRGLGAQRPKG